jgi:multidrug efflux pump
MNLTSYFIKHPVVTIVINSMILLVGLLCFKDISWREYPAVTIPSITVNTNYPNASAELVEHSVTNIIEDALAGVENLDEITSSSYDGSSMITLKFEAGSSLDKAMTDTRDAMGAALGRLPIDAKQPIIERQNNKNGPPFIALMMKSDNMSFADMTHYANLNIKNVMRSIKGVAGAEVWGQPYTYTVTLDPKKMYLMGVNASDVYNALQESDVSMPVGKYQQQFPITINSELTSIQEYEDLVIKKSGAAPVTLKAIAKITQDPDVDRLRIRVNGKPAVAIAINKTSDANPVEVSDLVHQAVSDLQKTLPQGMSVTIDLDQTDYIRASISNIKSSIFEAIMFVMAVIFIFIRNIRATIIPLLTIPISLIGGIIFLKIFGFSINILTLLAMVLAVGLVVDDAIVVLENITRHVEEGLKPLDAAILGAREIGFAVVAMTLTLTSVYMPIAFVEGTVGRLFLEFAVALAGSVLLSGITALTLSPLMCAYNIKHNEDRLLPEIDTFLDKLVKSYKNALSVVIDKQKTIVAILLSLLVVSVVSARMLPNEIVPKEDRNLVGIWMPPVPGASLDQMEQYTIRAEEIVRKVPEAKDFYVFIGDWGASTAVTLKTSDQRSRSAEEIIRGMHAETSSMPSVDAYEWSWSSGLPGMDDVMDGNTLQMAVSSVDSYREMDAKLMPLIKTLSDSGKFENASHDLKLDIFGYNIDLDNDIMSRLSLKEKDVAQSAQIFFSGNRSLEFQKDGIMYNIIIKPESYSKDLSQVYITNPSGDRISLSAVATMYPVSQPKSLYHFNQMRAATVFANMKQGSNMASDMSYMMKKANSELPTEYKKEWIGAAKALMKSANTMLLLFALATLFIYAILAIQFESFIDPLIVLITVPLACSGALVASYIFGQSLNIYVQVGLITLIGLVSKHGILIVEFANQQLAAGKNLKDAVQDAAVLRLRPILMTTGAMIFGIIPLIISRDAGYESRQAIGIVLAGGLVVGTMFTLFVLPTMYYMIKTLEARFAEK